MSHSPRSPSEVELQSLHLAFSQLAAPSAQRAPLKSPAYISDDDLNFEPLEPSAVELAEQEFAHKAQLALAAMSTPPASASAGSSRNTPDIARSPYSPERTAASGGSGSRDGYFSRAMYAGEERPSMSPYGANSPALSSGRSSPSHWNAASPHSAGPITPPVFDSPPPATQPITASALAQLNKASIKARGMRLPPHNSSAPTPFPSASDAPKTPQKTVKGFNLGLGLLSTNFEGISLATGGASGGRLPALAALDDLEAPSSPAFKTKPRMSQYAF